jgi:LysR family glycine cleavage system transcriptional activator
VSRLDRLRRDLPTVDLRLHTSDAVVDLRPGGVEAAIRYGKGPFVNSAPLCSDVFAPVCSPRLQITALADLREATLLHVDGRLRPQPLPDWRNWCAKAGAAGIDTEAGQHFPDSLLAVQAAIAGQGVAIVSLVLARDAISAGLLVSPFPTVLAGEIYHFAWAEGLQERTDLTSLRSWFARELKGTQDACGVRLRDLPGSK